MKGGRKGDWYHESFIRGRPERLSQMKRTRIKGTKKRQTRDKPKAQSFHPVQTSEEQEDATEPEYSYENCSCVSDNTRQMCNSSSPRCSPDFPESFEDIMADREISKGAACHSGCADNVVIRTFEPLPVHTAGILDGNMDNNELAEFGQLIDRLIY